MKRLTAYLAIAAAALALAASHHDGASAAIKRGTPGSKPRLIKPLAVPDKPCPLNFKPSKTGNFTGAGDTYTCTYAVLGHPCKQGYHPTMPAVVKVGNAWVIRYGCGAPIDFGGTHKTY